MILRKFDIEKDYNNYSQLSKDWKLPVTPKTWIPEDTYILEQNDEIIVLGMLYQFNQTPMFWIEGLITNKSFEKELRKEGIELIINKLYNIGKEKGAEIVMSSTPRNSLKDTFKSFGFLETPEQYYHLGRI